MKEIEVSLNGNLNLFKYFGKEMTIKKRENYCYWVRFICNSSNQNIYKELSKTT